MEENVKIFGKDSVIIDDTVVIGNNVTIYPNNIIRGNTVIGDNVVLMPSNYISNSKISNNVIIEYSYIEDSVVEEDSHIGPFSRLRPNAHIGRNCKIGNFVEVKNSYVGDGSKASHLAYIGDCDIGRHCNIGCGAIFVNYNGREKNRSVVEDECFVGSNVNVIAPVKLAKGSYVTAGTTITQNTEPNDFVIGRCREVIKRDYATKYRKGDNK